MHCSAILYPKIFRRKILSIFRRYGFYNFCYVILTLQKKFIQQ